MTKEQIKDSIAQKFGLSLEQSGEIFEHVIGTIKEEIHETGESRVPDLGTFHVKEAAARNRAIRNPRTGQPMGSRWFPAKKHLRFKPFDSVEDELN